MHTQGKQFELHHGKFSQSPLDPPPPISPGTKVNNMNIFRSESSSITRTSVYLSGSQKSFKTARLARPNR